MVYIHKRNVTHITTLLPPFRRLRLRQLRQVVVISRDRRRFLKLKRAQELKENRVMHARVAALYSVGDALNPGCFADDVWISGTPLEGSKVSGVVSVLPDRIRIIEQKSLDGFGIEDEITSSEEVVSFLQRREYCVDT